MGIAPVPMTKDLIAFAPAPVAEDIISSMASEEASVAVTSRRAKSTSRWSTSDSPTSSLITLPETSRKMPLSDLLTGALSLFLLLFASK